MNAADTDDIDRLVKEALTLMVRLNDASSGERIQNLSAWSSQSSLHAQALKQAEAEWTLFSQISDAPLTFRQRSGLVGQMIVASAMESPVKATAALLTMVSLAAGLLASSQSFTRNSPLATVIAENQEPLQLSQIATQIETKRGEQRTVTLESGVRLWLNWNTEISVTGREDQMNINVTRGDVLFSVPKENSGTLVVHAGAAIVQPKEAEFSVHSHGPEDAFFQVRRGRLKITSRAQEKARTIGAAQQAFYFGGVSQSEGRAKMSNIAAWRDGKIVFDESSLRNVLSELTHYTTKNIRVGSIAIDEAVISATYSIDQADEALLQLADTYHLELVNPFPDEMVVQSIDARRL